MDDFELFQVVRLKKDISDYQKGTSGTLINHPQSDVWWFKAIEHLGILMVTSEDIE